MNDAKYVGLDVHEATISAVVLDSAGKLLMESILETKAATTLQFVHGLGGSLHVIFEEGTCGLLMAIMLSRAFGCIYGGKRGDWFLPPWVATLRVSSELLFSPD